MQLGTELESNYYALCLCILSERIPEDTFKIMDVLPGDQPFDVTDVEGIFKLKKNHSWKQIGELYGVRADTIRRRAVRFLARQRECGVIG